MLLPRLIPCLLVHNKGLVKTVKFKDPKYVGDPINAVKIFNEKKVDELVVLDIDASANNTEPNYKMIEDLAAECRMPLCYGGGIKTVEQAKKAFLLGVEKIAFGALAVENPLEITRIISAVGSQSVVVVVDIKKKRFSGKYEVVINNGLFSTGFNPFEFVTEMEKLGVGELIINSVDRDGTMEGFDLELVDRIRNIVSIPINVIGGAGRIEDFGEIIHQHGIIGVAAGSYFVFKGKFRAVLINYPTELEKQSMFNKYYTTNN